MQLTLTNLIVDLAVLVIIWTVCYYAFPFPAGVKKAIGIICCVIAAVLVLLWALQTFHLPR